MPLRHEMKHFPSNYQCDHKLTELWNHLTVSICWTFPSLFLFNHSFWNILWFGSFPARWSFFIFTIFANPPHEGISCEFHTKRKIWFKHWNSRGDPAVDCCSCQPTEMLRLLPYSLRLLHRTTSLNLDFSSVLVFCSEMFQIWGCTVHAFTVSVLYIQVKGWRR